MDSLDIPILETERLRLRTFRKTDLDDYAALTADPEVMRYLGGTGPWSRDRSWRHMAFLLGHWQLGDAGMWAVEQRGTGTFLGMIGFAEPEGWPGFELAWTLARRWWGHGYATEGAQAALAHAFTVWQKDRVISLIHPENQASIRVAERLGERLQGRLDFLGREMLCYGIDRESYVRRQRAVLPSQTTAADDWITAAAGRAAPFPGWAHSEAGWSRFSGDGAQTQKDGPQISLDGIQTAKNGVQTSVDGAQI